MDKGSHVYVVHSSRVTMLVCAKSKMTCNLICMLVHHKMTIHKLSVTVGMGYIRLGGNRMAYSTKTTMIQTKQLLMMHKCAKCGKTSIQNVKVHAAAAYSDSGTLTQKGVDRRRKNAEDRLESSMLRTTTRLEEGDMSALRRSKMSCACPKCKKKKPWSTTEYLGSKFVLYLGIILGVFAIAGLDGYQHPIQLIPFACAVIALLRMVINEIIKAIQTHAVCKTCPPIFGESVEMLYEQAKRIPAYKETN